MMYALFVGLMCACDPTGVYRSPKTNISVVKTERPSKQCPGTAVNGYLSSAQGKFKWVKKIGWCNSAIFC